MNSPSKKPYKKLTKSQLKTLNLPTYKEEIVLVENTPNPTMDGLYFNAQMFYPHDELQALDTYGEEENDPQAQILKKKLQR